MSNRKLISIPIVDIIIGKRFRKKYEGIEELSTSIKETGLIQPVTINSKKELMAGGRRYMAHVMGQLSHIDCIMLEDSSSEVDLREVELVENLYRQDMTWHERAELTDYIDQLKKANDPNWSGRKTAELLGKGKSAVAKDLKLAEALKNVPELKNCKTEADANKVLVNISKKIDAQQAVDKHKENPAILAAVTHYTIGDAFLGMEEMYDANPNSMVSLIEIDPPYAIDLQNIKKADLTKDGSITNYNEVKTNDYEDFITRTCTDVFNCAGEDCWVIFWHAFQWQQLIRDSLEDVGFIVDPVPGIWLKGEDGKEGSGQTNQPKTYLARCYEPFLIARKGKPEVQKQGRSNVFSFKPTPAAQKYHPTQRPLALMNEIIKTFVHPNSIIMVPFLGSGITLRAAYQNHCTGFGWELNENNKPLFLASLLEDGFGADILEENTDEVST